LLEFAVAVSLESFRNVRDDRDCRSPEL